MGLFNRIPWFIPTKEDQRKWYTEELRGNPRELSNLLQEFQDMSERYNRMLGDFEANLVKEPYYEIYMDIKSMAQNLSFLWQRIEYKTKREGELKKMLSDLNY